MDFLPPNCPQPRFGARDLHALLYEHDKPNFLNVNNSLHGISTETCLCPCQIALLFCRIITYDSPEVQLSLQRMKYGMVPPVTKYTLEVKWLPH